MRVTEQGMIAFHLYQKNLKTLVYSLSEIRVYPKDVEKNK